MKRRRWPLENDVSWFLLASTLDVVMTHIVLHLSATGHTSASFVESNPLARWVIGHWGLYGMALFKAAMSLLVVVIANVVWQVRPWLAKALLWTGTGIVGSVVIYSIRLLLQHRLQGG